MCTMNVCCVCRMPLIDKFRDMGTVVMGKIESGSVRRGDTLMVMPNKVSVRPGLFVLWTCGKVDGAVEVFWCYRVCWMIGYSGIGQGG